MHEKTSELVGAKAIVTGSSSGIGRSIAIELARAGAHVLVHAGHHLERAEQVAGEIAAAGSHATTVVSDLATASGQTEFLTFVDSWTDSVDILVNNAGVDVLTGDAANWDFWKKLDQLWQVDVLATMRISRTIGATMRSRSESRFVPNILNIGWDQAEVGMAGDSGEMFGPIKAAVMAFTRSLAKSLAPQVRVNCLAPGWIRTSWGEHASEYWQQRAKSESLLNRWGTPEDVAQLARFLVSPASSYITGQVVAVNGGFAHGQRDH